MTRTTSERHELAMDKLATYMGNDSTMCALDSKLVDGGHLTNDEVDTIIRFFRWDNMSVGN